MLQIIVAALIRIASPEYPLTEAEALAHVQAADAAASATGVDRELLLGMAYVESRYVTRNVSRMQCSGTDATRHCKRVTGPWRSRNKPPGAQPSYYCGAVQVGGYIPWARCLELIDDVNLNYLFAAQHLLDWENDPACRHKDKDARLVCALRGNGGGYAAIKVGTSTYPYRCLKVAQFIRKLSGSEPQI